MLPLSYLVTYLLVFISPPPQSLIQLPLGVMCLPRSMRQGTYSMLRDSLYPLRTQASLDHYNNCHPFIQTILESGVCVHACLPQSLFTFCFETVCH